MVKYKKIVNLKIYWNYFKYIIFHKYYVFLECLKTKQLWHGITHDISKFRPSEFFPYAIKFYSGDYAYKYFEVEHAFDMAWLLHQHRNKHHWDYWVNSDGFPVPMPQKYILQMICDWKAMGAQANTQTIIEFYNKNKEKMKLHKYTIEFLEQKLNQ